MKCVAFIRGVGPENPNMHGKKLQEFFTALGFRHVIPVLSSGNVIFESNENDTKYLEHHIEEHLPKMLGFSRAVIIRRYEDLKKMFHSDPFQGAQDSPTSRLNVTFLKKGSEVFSVIDTVNSKTPKVMADLEKKYGKDITTRTWKTVEKILKRMEENR